MTGTELSERSRPALAAGGFRESNLIHGSNETEKIHRGR